MKDYKKEKKVLILGASELQVPAIDCANRLGVGTVVCDFDPKAVGSEIADKFYCVSTLDYDAVLEVAKSENVDGILTICSDRPMTIVAGVGTQLGLNTISEESAVLATNKAKMRQALKAHEVPVPEFAICRSKEEYLEEKEKFGYPFIVKPSDNSGSRGIMLVEEEADASAAYDYARENTLDGIVLVEEYMTGPEVSVEVFVLNGKPEVIQITDKITTGAPHFVEMGHTQPSRLDESVRNDIADVAVRAVSALGIDKGPAHVEIKATKQGAKIVELGARLGGDYIATDLTPASTGFNMVEAVVYCALGEELPEYERIDRCAAIRYFAYSDSINLTNDVITQLERIYLNRIDADKIKSSRDREGFFVVSADDFEELNKKIDIVSNRII